MEYKAKNYLRFTGPARLHKSISTLRGLLAGIAADGHVTVDEAAKLQAWLEGHKDFSNKHPFNEVFPALHKVLEDGAVTQEEAQDLSWLTERLTTDESFYGTSTAGIQELHGLLSGMAADKKITAEEVAHLSQWIDTHSHLKTLWPYDEIESLVTRVLEDKVVDAKEQAELLTIFGEFTAWPQRGAIEARDLSLSGVCALTPDIVFPAKLFCLTGESKKHPRAEVVKIIESKGGRYNDNLVTNTDFLVVGASGNPCWAYACYGRKIEKAVKNRVKGATTLIVHENDFWDSVSG